MTFTNIIPYYSTNETFSTGKEWCDTPSTTMFWTTPSPTAALYDESPAPTVNPTMEPTASSLLEIGAPAPQRGKVTNYLTMSPSVSPSNTFLSTKYIDTEWSELGVSEKSNIFETSAQNSWIVVVMVISVLVLCVLCLCGCLVYTLWRQDKQLRDSKLIHLTTRCFTVCVVKCILTMTDFHSKCVCHCCRKNSNSATEDENILMG